MRVVVVTPHSNQAGAAERFHSTTGEFMFARLAWLLQCGEICTWSFLMTIRNVQQILLALWFSTLTPEQRFVEICEHNRFQHCVLVMVILGRSDIP